MEMPVLQVAHRSLKQKAKSLRTAGKIPAIYYGHGKENIALEVDYQTFRKTFTKSGESTVIELELDKKKIPVLVHEVQYNPITDTMTHIDFYHVDMEKEVTTKVPVKLVGLAPAVKNLHGILTTHKHEITIRCLPKYLIHEIEADVSVLVDFHRSVHVRDLKFGPEIKVLDSLGDTVANVRPQRVEEEAPKAEVAVEGAVEGAVAGAPAVAGATPAAGAAAGAPAPAAKKEEKKK